MNDVPAMPGAASPLVSIVVPVKNEQANIGPLVTEIGAALTGRWPFEVICVNDGSRDGTEGELDALMAKYPWLRHLKHVVSCGQSAAVRSGVAAARGTFVATLDGDGQNDPRFLPEMLEPLVAGTQRLGLVAGQRVGRQATGFKKFQSLVANDVRRIVLRDGARDSGCGLKAFPRDVFLTLPFFDGLHRFLPALFRREGYDVAYVDVVDRQRRHGKSNYGMMDRLVVGLLDLAGVWWLMKRRRHVPSVSEVKRNAG
ncbi:MAG TPA: glycosyltransferase family 2 protein [Xanthobacteraceae bacterium]|nr:glycosyltransferase family 2 protein [Xanthobacteraceae bacterium]